MVFYSMIQANYDQLLERISRLSSLTKEELERRIDAKRAKLSGLISKEGAAQIVAAELGVNFENQRMKISELLMGLRKANVLGKILKIEPVRNFKKGEREGKIGVLRVADETGSIRVVLWDTNHISLIEKKEIGEGDVVEINAASVRGLGEKELHLSSTSNISKSDVKLTISESALNQMLSQLNDGIQKPIAEAQINERIRANATLIRFFEPRFFTTCPECNIKIVQQGEHFYCSTHGNVIPQYKAIMTVVFDDGTDNIRSVLFDDAISQLLNIEKGDISKLKDSAFLTQKKLELLGKDFFVSGRVRLNKLFNDPEMIISDLQEANPDELIKQLSA